MLTHIDDTKCQSKNLSDIFFEYSTKIVLENPNFVTNEFQAISIDKLIYLNKQVSLAVNVFEILRI